MRFATHVKSETRLYRQYTISRDTKNPINDNHVISRTKISLQLQRCHINNKDVLIVKNNATQSWDENHNSNVNTLILYLCKSLADR